MTRLSPGRVVLNIPPSARAGAPGERWLTGLHSSEELPRRLCAAGLSWTLRRALRPQAGCRSGQVRSACQAGSSTTAPGSAGSDAYPARDGRGADQGRNAARHLGPAREHPRRLSKSRPTRLEVGQVGNRLAAGKFGSQDVCRAMFWHHRGHAEHRVCAQAGAVFGGSGGLGRVVGPAQQLLAHAGPRGSAAGPGPGRRAPGPGCAPAAPAWRRRCRCSGARRGTGSSWSAHARHGSRRGAPGRYWPKRWAQRSGA